MSERQAIMRRQSMHSRVLALLAVAISASAIDAQADCAGASVAETKRHFAKGQELERAGQRRDALVAYVAAQEYTCEPNPVELNAAQRAAALALPLAQAAEQAKDYDAAYRLYDDGGHFAAADRALLALLRAQADDPSLYSRAREFFEYRASPAFQANNRVRLGLTGPYVANAQHLVEVRNLPNAGAERAFKAEAAAFNEQYLREYVEIVQSRPEDQTDHAAVQRFANQMQSFHQRWANDPLKTSRDALQLAHAWSAVTNDAALANKIAAKRRERLEQRIVTITRTYARAPQLLEAAIDYQMAMHIDEAAKQSRVTGIRNHAATLADQAMQQQRFGLAADYYVVARLDAKAAGAREQQQHLAMATMQPTIDAMRKQAEDMQKAFSDPQKVKDMQEQARAMQQAIQAQQQANAKGSAKQTDDLEKELGL